MIVAACAPLHKCRWQPSQSESNCPAVLITPELKALLVCTVIKLAVRSEIAGHGLPQVVGAKRIGVAVALLRVVACSAEIDIRTARRKLLTHNCRYCGAAYINFAASMMAAQ
jgi:hypothetical protein